MGGMKAVQELSAGVLGLLFLGIGLNSETRADRVIAGLDPVFDLADTFPDDPLTFGSGRDGDILVGDGTASLGVYDRNAAMATGDGMGISSQTQRIGSPFPANGLNVVNYSTGFVQSCVDWENVLIQANPGLGATVFLRLAIRIDGSIRTDAANAFYTSAFGRFHVQLDDQESPVSLSNPFFDAVPVLFTDFIEVPVGSPFRLRMCLSGEIEVIEGNLLELGPGPPETYDVFASINLTAAVQGAGLFSQADPEFPVEALLTVDGAPAPLRAVPPTLAEQLAELTRASIRGEIQPTQAGTSIITLSGSSHLEGLAANLPFRVVAEVESNFDVIRFGEAGLMLLEGLIDPDEYQERQERANEISALFRDIKLEPTFAESRRNAVESAAEILIYGLIELFFGSDPFAALYTPDQPLTLPIPDPSTLTFTTGPANAGVQLTLPPIWGGGSRDPDVLSSAVSVRYEGGQFELLNLETNIASYEIVGGQQTGVNRGFFPAGAQVWSDFDLVSGEFVAHGEGHITNDLYPANRPIFVFQDIGGRLLLLGGGTQVEAVADNEPMIVPGLPGSSPAPQPIASAATRATFDASTNQLRLGENTDLSLPPEVSVVLTPDAVFGFGLDNSGEPLVGAQVIVSPLTPTSPVIEGEDTTFGNATIEIRSGGGGVLASGQLTDVRIEADILALIADVALDPLPNPGASPFLDDWHANPGPILLLGRIGTLDLLAATADLSVSGNSPTDFISLTRQVASVPDPGPFQIIAFRTLDAGFFELAWNSLPGESYRVEFSTDGRAWSPVPGQSLVPSQGLQTATEVMFDAASDPTVLVRVARL